jgi:ribosome-associated translation inhibitor RaiA
MTILQVIDQGRLLTPVLAGRIEDRAFKLAHYFDGVEECRVRVDGPGPHHRQGRIRVRIHLTVSGSGIAINHRTGEDLPAAIRDSFDAADHRLIDFARRSRHTEKDRHSSPRRGSPTSQRHE